MKKKWWILNHHSEGNCFYMVNATVEEIDTLRCCSNFYSAYYNQTQRGRL